MSTRIKDLAGQSLIVLFLIKPTIDLFWSQYLTLGPLHISALHVTGVLVFLYFGFLLFRTSNSAPRYGWLFVSFILLHLVSISVGLFYSTNIDTIKIIDVLLRVLDSYLIFRIAYDAGINGRYEAHHHFLKAVVIGTSIALAVNTLAIILGYGGGREVIRIDEQFVRQQGLYYDPGVLALVAVYNIIFIAYLFKQMPRGRYLYRLLMIGMIFISLYMVYVSVSRAAVLLLAVFSMIYIAFVQKGSQKVIAIAFIAITIVASSAMFGLQAEKFQARFESEISTLTSDNTQSAPTAGDRISFGRFEGLGSNRVRLWAVALDRVLQRSTVEITVGSFFESSPSHSDYFDVLTRNGIIGLLIYVLMLLLFWKRTLSMSLRRGLSYNDKVIHALAFTLITLYVIYAFPFRPLSYTTTAWYLWAVVGFSFARMRLSLREASEAANSAGTQRILRPAAERGHLGA